jgi:hypothetical protein
MQKYMERPPIKIYYCYAREDEALRARLAQHLEPLKREGLIVTWHACEISPGKDLIQEIYFHLDTSDILLALITPAFMSSTYCQDIEIRRAFERHSLGEMRVIPIILRPVDWQHTLLGKLQALPKDGKPIIKWKPVDDGWQSVATDVRKVVVELREKQLVFSPDLSLPYEQIGMTFMHSGFYEGALDAFKQAIHYDPENIVAWEFMISTLIMMNKCEEAISMLDKTLQKKPSRSACRNLYFLKAEALKDLGRIDEANIILEEMRRIEQEDGLPFPFSHFKGRQLSLRENQTPL